MINKIMYCNLIRNKTNNYKQIQIMASLTNTTAVSGALSSTKQTRRHGLSNQNHLQSFQNHAHTRTCTTMSTSKWLWQKCPDSSRTSASRKRVRVVEDREGYHSNSGEVLDKYCHSKHTQQDNIYEQHQQRQSAKHPTLMQTASQKYLQKDYNLSSIQNTPARTAATALTSRTTSKMRMLSPRMTNKNSMATAPQSISKVASRQFTGCQQTSPKRKLAININRHLQSQKQSQTRHLKAQQKKVVKGNKKQTVRDQDNTEQVSSRKIKVMGAQSALNQKSIKKVTNAKMKQSTKRMGKQNQNNNQDDFYERDLSTPGVQDVSGMEFKPTISILDSHHKQSQNSFQNNNVVVSVHYLQQQQLSQCYQEKLLQNQEQFHHQQKSHEQIPLLKSSQRNSLDGQDEFLFRSSGGAERRKENMMRASHCMLTLTPMSQETEAHLNYVDASISHRNIEPSEYGDPVDQSLRISQLALKEQQSSNIFKLPLQRKSRKDRQKQRQDSAMEIQKMLGVKNKYNQRISCMSPDEYRSPMIKEFNSTGQQPTTDISNQRPSECDIFRSQMMDNNIKIIEDLSDYQKFASRQLETALKTQGETLAQTSEILNEKISPKRSKVLLSPQIEESLVFRNSKNNTQRQSIMSPRLVPTTHIDLAEMKLAMHQRIGTSRPSQKTKKEGSRIKRRVVKGQMASVSNSAVSGFQMHDVQKKMKQMFDNKQTLSKLKQVQKDFDAKNKSSSPLTATIRILDNGQKTQRLLTKKSAIFSTDNVIKNIEKKQSSKQIITSKTSANKLQMLSMTQNLAATRKSSSNIRNATQTQSLNFDFKDQVSRSRPLLAGPSNPSIYNQTTTCSIAEMSQARSRTAKEFNTEKYNKNVIATTAASGMESTAQETMTMGHYGQETLNPHSISVNQSLNHFQKTAFGILNTAECNLKSKYQKLNKQQPGPILNSTDREESKQADVDFKFTNRSRPRCLPVNSSIFYGSQKFDKDIQKEELPTDVVKNEYDLHEEEKPIGTNQTVKTIRKIDSKTIERNRAKSVKYSLERQKNEQKNMFGIAPLTPASPSHQGAINLNLKLNSNGKLEKIRDKSVPKLTITFTDRKVSVETSRGRESSQKKFLRNIENEITKYQIKKSRQNSNSTICISNDARSLLDRSKERPLFLNLNADRGNTETKSLRPRSPDQLSAKSKGSVVSRHFDPKKLLRLFGSAEKQTSKNGIGAQQNQMKSILASQTSTINEIAEDQCQNNLSVDFGIIKAKNTQYKLGDPIDNVATNTIPLKDLSMSRDQHKPIYLESEDKWFENVKLLNFYQKYDKDSLGRFEYNNPTAKVAQLVNSKTDAILMGQIHKKPQEFTNLSFMPQMQEKVLGEGSILRFKPQYRPKNEKGSLKMASFALKHGTFEKVYCQLTQLHLNIFLNCRDKIDSLKLLKQNYYKNFVKRKNLNYRELIEKYSRYPKQTKNIDEFLEFLAEPSEADMRIKSIPIQDIVDMKQLTPKQLEAIGVKNSTENIVRLVLRDEIKEQLKPLPAQSECDPQQSYMDNTLQPQSSNCNEILGFSGCQYFGVDVNLFDQNDHERSTLLDIMLEQDGEDGSDAGTKKFEEDFRLFENFMQNRDAQNIKLLAKSDSSDSIDGTSRDSETPDGLGEQYLLKIDELPSEQSETELGKNGHKKKTQIPETHRPKVKNPRQKQDKPKQKPLHKSGDYPLFLASNLPDKNLKKNMAKQFAELSFPKIIKTQGMKCHKVSRNYTASGDWQPLSCSLNSKNTQLSSKRNTVRQLAGSSGDLGAECAQVTKNNNVDKNEPYSRQNGFQKEQSQVVNMLKSANGFSLHRSNESLALTPTVAMELTSTRERDVEKVIVQNPVPPQNPITSLRTRHTYEQIHNKILEVVFDKRPKPFPKNRATADWVEQSIEPPSSVSTSLKKLPIDQKCSLYDLKNSMPPSHFKRAVSVRHDLEHRGRTVTSDDGEKGKDVKSYMQAKKEEYFEKCRNKRRIRNEEETEMCKLLLRGLIFKLT